MEAGEGDVRVIGTGFRGLWVFWILRGEAVAGHAGGDLRLEMEERAGRVQPMDG